MTGLKAAHAYLGHVGVLVAVLDELEPLLRRQGDLFRLRACRLQVGVRADSGLPGPARRDHAVTRAPRRGRPAAGGAGLAAGDAWVLGYEAYLSVARSWLTAAQPERARAVLAPLLTAVERGPWVAGLAAALVVDARALGCLGEPAHARLALNRGTALARDHGLVHVLRDARTAASLLR